MSQSTRRLSSFLPEVLQTDILKKFFAASGDFLFQQENVETLYSYIGQKPAWYNAQTDKYVNEPTASRQNYQLEPGAVSRDPASGTINSVMCYDDLLNKLRFQGALTDDHNRLFEAEYYSFGLPIDIDKLLNFQNYVWLASGPAPIQLLDTTDLINTITGKSEYTYTGRYAYTTDPTNIITGSLNFTSGLKLVFPADETLSIRANQYIIEGVGRSIRPVLDTIDTSLSWENPNTWDTSVWDGNSLQTYPNYVLIGRGSANGNPWSVGNRWFHKDILALSNMNVTNIYSITAQRPILEFDYSLKLWNFGTQSRGSVNLVDTDTRFLTSVVGQSSVLIDGIKLDDGMQILFTNLRDPNTGLPDTINNNKIYLVNNLRDGGEIVLTPVANGTDATGAPVTGDSVSVTQGTAYTSTSWWFNGISWVLGQSRQLTQTPGTTEFLATLNQAPLFELFDTNGTSLADPAVYVDSNFSGCTLVEYQTTSVGTPDSVLGFTPVYQGLSALNFVFNNTLVTNATSYATGNTRTNYTGYAFWQQLDAITGSTRFQNNWFRSASPTRQYVVNEFVATANQNTFTIDQAPDLAASAPPAITVEIGSQNLQIDRDFTVSGTTVTINTQTVQVAADSYVKIRSWAGLSNHATNGYFEIPQNLQANPNNQDISSFAYSDLVRHLTSVIQQQSGAVWRDTAQDQSLGNIILQHRAPMLKLMGINAVSETDVFQSTGNKIDPASAIDWAQREYLRFYNKFVNTIFNLYTRQAYTANDTPMQWLTAALYQINLGKTSASAWANSGIDMTGGSYCGQQSTNPTYVPTTPTRLGVTPAWYPVAFYDSQQPDNPLSLRCHNGAVVVLRDSDNTDLGGFLYNLTSTSNPLLLTHPVARAWLLFELLQYQTLPLEWQDPNHSLSLDSRTIFSGKYRTKNYSWSDKLALEYPKFQQWLTTNQIDAFRNTTYDVQDPFSWNYSGCVDVDGEPVPGNWRGIYRWYYDTDRPHLAPWEMLGFTQKPDWWDAQYGSAPYTSGNTRMWSDLAAGRIVAGSRAGVYSDWARPTLLDHLPVDAIGNLATPWDAKLITSLPSVAQASADWKWGDGGPIETVWRTAVDYDYVMAKIAYLAKPPQFIEYLWDGPRTTQLWAGTNWSQWIWSDTNTRKSSLEFLVHRENPSTISYLTNSATYYGSCGIQQWISEKLVSDSISVTTYFGNIIRGMQSNLAHRMAGFVDGSNLKITVDSFGITQNDNLLLPQEDVSVELLRSASTQEYIYSGAIVEYLGQSGWRVIGYDSVDPYFTVIPSDTAGAKNTVVIENQRVTEYQSGLDTTIQVPYGTVFTTRQQVYDFLVSLGRYQIQQGWIFDQYDNTTGLPRDWSLSAREFLYWSQGPWAPGTYIALSPLATLAQFSTAQGIIQNVGNQVNGAQSVLDKRGITIGLGNLDFLRIDNQVSVRLLNDQGIYGLRLYTTTLEHALVFSNFTVFNDLIYDPVFNIRQSRIKLFGYRTLNWTGRLDAPGYMVTQTNTTVGNSTVVQNQIIPNFEKSVDDLRKLFANEQNTPYYLATDPTTHKISTITQSLTPTLTKLARHLIGYQSRSYLTNLLVDESTAYEFYKGFITQKGTYNSVTALLRHQNVLPSGQTLNYYEEYAFRKGQYGYVPAKNQISILLPYTEITADPQLINLQADPENLLPGEISIQPQDPSIVDQTVPLQQFWLRTSYGDYTTDLPSAGYVQIDETTYTVNTIDDLLALFTQTVNTHYSNPALPILSANNTVWQIMDANRGWNVYKLCSPSWTIVSSSPSPYYPTITTITTSDPHGLNLGDIVVIYGVVNAGLSVDNTYIVQAITATTFDITLTSSAVGSGGTVLVYRTVRFASTSKRDTVGVLGGWKDGDRAYIDGNSQTPWQVYEYLKTQWILIRQESLKVDPDYVSASSIYDSVTNATLLNLTYWDPQKNRLPGILDSEIAFKSMYDPARYNVDPSNSNISITQDIWGEEQVGVLWWDLSTTRFVDYEQGDHYYRQKYWGQIVPGTTVDVYEWTRSTLPPSNWNQLVQSGTDMSAIGTTNLPSGTTQGNTQPYVQRTITNSAGQSQTVFYYWVKNVSTIPSVSWRNTSASVVAQSLADPKNSAIAWWAPVDSTTVLMGNVREIITANTVAQFSWTNSKDTELVHSQWQLGRPGDPLSAPDPDIWNTMRYTLCEFDDNGNSRPDLRLPESQQYGILNQPAQIWLDDVNGARELFVNTFNSILASSSVPSYTDSGRQGWQSYFNSGEPVPPSVDTLDSVDIATNSEIPAYYIPYDGGDRLVLKTSDPTSVFSISSPVGLPAGQTWIQIVAGKQHTLGLTSSGALYAWGLNTSGQLGINSTVNTSVPVLVSGPSGASWSSISAGDSYSVGIATNGQLYAWGNNNSGQIGNGSVTSSSRPTLVSAPSGTSWAAVAAGGSHVLAVSTTGLLYAWGDNTQGQLGTNNTTAVSVPTLVSGPASTSWSVVAAHSNHSFAISTDFVLYGWGSNTGAELGINVTTKNSHSSPVMVSGPSGVSWVQVATGNSHTVAITANNELYAWGSNTRGQVGVNGPTTSVYLSPVTVAAADGSYWTNAACGDNHTLAIDSTGVLWAWGDNSVGQLGLNSLVPGMEPSPVMVSGPTGTSWSVISAGTSHSMAISFDNTVYGWGGNSTGQIGVSGVMSIDGSLLTNGLRVLVKNQPETSDPDRRGQNGVYRVVDAYTLQRDTDFSVADQMTTGTTVSVLTGYPVDQNGNLDTTWHMVSSNVINVGIDPVIWISDTDLAWISRTDKSNWDQQVDTQTELQALTTQVALYTKVLVNSVPWSIWQLVPDTNGIPYFELVRTQSYQTNKYWNTVDWYATGYSSATIPDLVFNTLQERDSYSSYSTNQVVKVNNTGNGTWSLYLYIGTTAKPTTGSWQLVGQQSGGIELSSALWDYASYDMGFDGGGFDTDFQGFEYDSRLELNEIIKGSWIPSSGTLGLLATATDISEPNQIFYTMIHKVFEDQSIVDWVFPTSHISFTGFGQNLTQSAFYYQDQIENLIDYINEIKPYHTIIRNFVDYRNASENWTNNSQDFDKPVYYDSLKGYRVLNPNNAQDQLILSQNSAYTSWYNNYLTNPELIRTINTKLIFDRVAGAQSFTYSPGYSSSTPIDRYITDINEWLDILFTSDATTIPIGYVVSIKINQPKLFVRNTSAGVGYTTWTASDYGLNTTATINQFIYDQDTLLNVIRDSFEPEGYAVVATVDNLTVTNIYVRTSTTESDIANWTLVGYQHVSGAIDRITDQYVPIDNETPLNSKYLISGVAGKRDTLDGYQFSNTDSWDSSVWDNIRGWDYTSGSFNPYDENLEGGIPPGYWAFVGDGTTTRFNLPNAPQNPRNLSVWIDGTPYYSPQDWYIPNKALNVKIANPGLGYQIGNILKVQGGTTNNPIALIVKRIDPIGAITEISLDNPGTYTMVPTQEPATVSGGNGILATVEILWAGDVLVFNNPPAKQTGGQPNIWILEQGSTFNSAVSGVLDTVFDGSRLSSPDLDPDHPEELNKLWNRDSLIIDVFTEPSAGWGNIETQVFVGDGNQDHFQLAQPIAADTQIWVYRDGLIATNGITADYVVNYEYQQIIFTEPPVAGTRITVVTVGFGGATKSMGDFSITNPGSGYNVYDIIELEGGSIIEYPVVTVTAVTAVEVSITTPGANYNVGDQLILKGGASKQALVLTVTQVQAQGTQRGLITEVSIEYPGYYTAYIPGNYQWYSTGGGTGAVINIVWGVADIFIDQRGIYFDAPESLSQHGQPSNPVFGPSAGTGLTLMTNPGIIREQHTLHGDGTTNTIPLTSDASQDRILVLYNGQVAPYSIKNNSVVLAKTPAIGDTVFVIVYNSSLYSVNNVQEFNLNETLIQALDYAPGYLPQVNRDILVYNTGKRLRNPWFWQETGDGMTMVYTLPRSINTGDSNVMVTVWLDQTTTNAYTITVIDPTSSQITFTAAPYSGSQITVQVIDNTAQDYDFQIITSNNQPSIQFATWAAQYGDHIKIITFTEDTQTSFVQDSWHGPGNTYNLTNTPVNYGSLQVWVNGKITDQIWDYRIAQNAGVTQIVFNSEYNLVSTDTIQATYPVRQAAKSGVGMRLFRNIYGDTLYQRLSDQRATRLSADLNYNDENLYVLDGRNLPGAQIGKPGALWIEGERIEYETIEPQSADGLPYQYVLGRLRRGTQGTPSGVPSNYVQQSYNGTNQTANFLIPGDWAIQTNQSNLPLYVMVDKHLQKPGVDYSLITVTSQTVSQYGLIPGSYVRFATDNIPPTGNQNVTLYYRFSSVTQSTISHAAGALVRDASTQQTIPGGYIWPSGNAGIQFSSEPQTQFLLAEPGSRLI
jgi:alpha-tubulin suppressor-like RCC1 family protein